MVTIIVEGVSVGDVLVVGGVTLEDVTVVRGETLGSVTVGDVEGAVGVAEGWLDEVWASVPELLEAVVEFVVSKGCCRTSQIPISAPMVQ